MGLVASTSVGTTGLGSIASAGSFSANYAFSVASSVIQNYDQIRNSTPWGAFGLIAGYELFSAIQAGFNSDNMKAKIDKSMEYKYLFDSNEKWIKDNTGATSSMLGGILSSAGKEVFRSYDPLTKKWNIDGGKIIFKSLLVGGAKGFIGTQTMNENNEWFNIIFQVGYNSITKKWWGDDEINFNFF